jgi:hypothetical protein
MKPIHSTSIKLICIILAGLLILSGSGIQQGFIVLTRSGNTSGYVNFTGSLTGTGNPCLDGSGNLTVSGCVPSGSSGNAVTSTTPVTVSAAVTSDQQLMELSLTAGYLNTLGTPFVFNGSGLYTTAIAQTPTLTFKVKLCTVSGCGSGTVVTLVALVSTATLAAVTNNPWNLNVTGVTHATGATGTLEIHGPLILDLGIAATTVDSAFLDTNTAVSGTIDLTAALFVDFSVTTSTGNAGNSITQRSGAIMPQVATSGGGGGTVSFAQPYATDGTNFFGPIFQTVKPLDTTWINQNGSTRTVTNGSVFIDKPTVAGHDDISCRVLVIPGAPTPYTVTVGYIFNILSFSAGGVGGYVTVVDTASGKQTVAGHLDIASFNTSVFHVTTPTTNFATAFSMGGVFTQAPIWVRIKDDGTNLLYSASVDGINFIQFFSEADTTFMAVAAQAGFCVQNESALLDAGMTVFHMSLTIP